jgi:ABC-type proline/glycine betaine transport system ATPase subunit
MFNNYSKSNNINVIYVDHMLLRWNIGYVLQGAEAHCIIHKYFISGFAEVP